MTTDLLEQALQRPDAYLFIDRLTAALGLEKATRLHFYEIVEENRKVEFINDEIVFHSPVKRWHNDATGNVYELLLTQPQAQIGVRGYRKTPGLADPQRLRTRCLFLEDRESRFV